MAEVKWQKRAEQELYRYLVKGFLEFGESTANKFAERVSYLNSELGKYPEIGFPEPLLKGRKKKYRAYHINALSSFTTMLQVQTQYTFQIYGM